MMVLKLHGIMCVCVNIRGIQRISFNFLTFFVLSNPANPGRIHRITLKAKKLLFGTGDSSN